MMLSVKRGVAVRTTVFRLESGRRLAATISISRGYAFLMPRRSTWRFGRWQ